MGTHDKRVDVQLGDEREVYTQILDMAKPFPPQYQLRDILNMEVGPSKENRKRTLEVELEQLPSHLRHEFLGPNDTFSIIVSASLDGTQIIKLLSMLRKYRGATCYSNDDIKGISPSFCMHQILLDNESRLSRQPQCRLNPNMQGVVKKELVKLLAAGIIYPVLDSD